MFRNVAVHAENVQNVIRVVVGILFLLVAKRDIAVELIPWLPFADEREYLIVEVDDVLPFDLLVFFGPHSVSGVENVNILFDDPVKRCNEALIVEVGEIIKGKCAACFADVDTLERFVVREIDQDQAVGVAGADVIEVDSLTAQRELHLAFEDAIGYGGWQLVSNDRFYGILVRDRRCARLLKDLGTANMIEMGVAKDHVFDRHLQLGLNLIKQPASVAGSPCVDHQGAVAAGQYESGICSGRTADPTVEVAFDLSERVWLVRAGGGTGVRSNFS